MGWGPVVLLGCCLTGPEGLLEGLASLLGTLLPGPLSSAPIPRALAGLPGSASGPVSAHSPLPSQPPQLRCPHSKANVRVMATCPRPGAAGKPYARHSSHLPTFSWAFFLDTSSIQLSSSRVSTNTALTLSMSSLTWGARAHVPG